MGYSITIGELCIEKSPDDGLDCRCINFGADGAHHETAPAFGEPTDFTNERWPSYSAWSNFTKAVGLYEIFFTDDGHLIGGHPGVRLITKDMVDIVSNALTNYSQTNPGVKTEFTEGDDRGGWMCRLVWLDYWLQWAFKNCDTPVIANT